MKHFKALPVILAALLSFGAAKAQKASVAVRKAAIAQATTQPGMSQYTTYDFNWAYTSNLPTCVSTNIACFDGFVLTNTTLNQVIATETAIGPTLKSYSYSPAAGIPYGTTNFTLTAHGYDETGAAISSAPASVAVTVKVTALNAPTNVTGTVQ